MFLSERHPSTARLMYPTLPTIQYKIIKVITFYPRFVVKNTLRDPICIRPAGSTYTLTLQPDERQALHWLRRDHVPQMVMSYPSINRWSAPFNMRDVGDIHVRLSNADGGETLIRTDVALTGAVVFLTISREERGWPIVIENASDFPFSISQVVSAIWTTDIAPG